MKKNDLKYSLLRQYFGHSSFRPGQEAIIDEILKGRDVLGILPTGTGKSLCCQLPALIFTGLTIVVTPLIALMQNQTDILGRRGIPAAMLSSGSPPGHRRNIYEAALSGRLKLLYVSPERLQSPDFLSFAAALCRTGAPGISMICIDEAHCISRWGHDFRPSYLNIRDFAAFLERKGQRPRMAAFTATASPDVRSDILSFGGLRRPFIYSGGFDRPNLYYEVRRPKHRYAELLRTVRHYRHLSGIIYCSTRKNTEAAARFLSSHQIPCGMYHAGMTIPERAAAQKAWIEDRVPVIAATSAFGMGIDKPDVRFVIHFNMPADPDAYYQEAGRAGRDGAPSDCILFYNARDAATARFFIAGIRSAEKKAHAEEDLFIMRSYASGRTCLRASLLSYYGQHAAPFCGNCSVCLMAAPGRKSAPAGTEDPSLYRELAALRKRTAAARGLLPSQIFPDRALHSMAARRPASLIQMAAMEDVSLWKTIKYGAEFLKEIRAAAQDS